MRFKLRKVWHDLYYALASERAAKFAMCCRDVAAQVDISDSVDSWILSFRLKLHVSLCQACSNYLVFSRFLKQKMALLSRQKFDAKDLVDVNQKLMQEHARKN